MKAEDKILGVIPARYESQRLPGKVLREIAGKPMIQLVYEAASRSLLLHEVLVATDSSMVEEACRSRQIPVMLTGQHPSGSDRLFEVMQRTDATIYVNIQGDEPMVRPEHIDLLVAPFEKPEIEVSTLKVAISPETAQNPNVVKVVTDTSGRALYFSRCPIPYHREPDEERQYFKHLGLYAFRRQALERFHSLPQSSLEVRERLEQLRFLENGIAIQVAETAFDTVGVDTEEDLLRVEAILRAERT